MTNANQSPVVQPSIPGQLHVTIVIPSRNREKDLEKCLDSVVSQSYRDFDIVVIDNGTRNLANSFIERYPARIIRNSSFRLSTLFNLGWRACTSEYLVYLADDVELEKDWLLKALEAVSRFPRVAAVGGPIITTGDQEMHRLYVRAQNSSIFRLLLRVYERIVMEDKLLKPGQLASSGAYSFGASLSSSLNLTKAITVDLLTTSAMMLRRSVLARLGGFDEDFFFNHADGDLFVRMKKAGYELLFDPRVVAYHHVRVGPSRDPYFIGRDTGYFLAKDIRPDAAIGWLRFALNLGFIVGYWASRTAEMGDSRNLRAIVGLWHGWRNYFGK